MKNLFPQFNTSSDINQEEIWKEAVFIFDTNVLLNIYRYKPAVIEELLNVLETLKQRIWIPHHVALEFQKNRLTVIRDQLKLFIQVRQAIDGVEKKLSADIEKLELRKKNSSISMDPFTEGVSVITSKFIKELETLEEQQQKLTGPDKLKDKIESLFQDRVGPSPKDQESINEIYESAEIRFKNLIPPGYKDYDKKKNEVLNEHQHDGIKYKRHCGDYLIWKQILDYAKAEEKKNIVFVTGDDKEDWWLDIDAGGKKRIGPRPELIDEIRTYSGVEGFLMYGTESFLNHSKKFINARVSEETLKEVSEIKRPDPETPSDVAESASNDYQSNLLLAVHSWLTVNFGHVFQNPDDPFEFKSYDSAGFSAYKVRYGGLPPLKSESFISILLEARDKLYDEKYRHMTIIFIVKDEFHAQEVISNVANTESFNVSGELYLATASYSQFNEQIGRNKFHVFNRLRVADLRYRTRL